MTSTRSAIWFFQARRRPARSVTASATTRRGATARSDNGVRAPAANSASAPTAVASETSDRRSSVVATGLSTISGGAATEVLRQVLAEVRAEPGRAVHPTGRLAVSCERLSEPVGVLDERHEAVRLETTCELELVVVDVL